MSKWTYVRGMIKVDTYADSDAAAMFMAQTVVNHLPRITGSESDAQLYCIRPNGHTGSSNVDEFNQSSNLYTDSYFKSFETQPAVIIVLDGSLRDRTFNETLQETTAMLTRLSSRLHIEACVVSVADYLGKSFVFNNPRWLIDMPTSDWAYSLLTRINPNESDEEER